MHNIDRTNQESTYGEYPGEFSGEYAGEYAGEYPGEYSGEYAGEFSGEYAGEYPGEFGGSQEFETYGEYSQEGTFSEAEEMELAAELLAVSNEAELEQFFGSLFKKVGGFLKSDVGRSIGGALKGIAKKALPMLGSAVGNMIVPGLGGVIGGKLASAAGGMLGLELEGLSQEDQEFEVARQIVRLGAAAAGNAAQANPAAPPAQVAQAALTAAARQFAPGLLSNAAAQTGAQQTNLQFGAKRGRKCLHQGTGRWVRRGRSIILHGV